VRGGKRIGSGRKKGVPNKRTTALLDAVAQGGQMPLQHMLDRMRDPLEDPKIRAQMAIAAAPYVHPKISAIELTGQNGEPIEQRIVALLVDGTEATFEEV
jgi:hypothetical protein